MGGRVEVAHVSNSTNSNIPQPGASFLVGRPEPISPVWWAFLLALFERTGGTGTPTPVKQIDYTPLIEDIFTAGTNFIPGTTTTLTLSKGYTSAAAVLVHFDGTFQATDQYSVSGNTITFTSAIPVGVSKVYARG
jgi:hypothetical protein